MTEPFDRQAWARDLLTRMNYPVNDNNMTTVLAWENQEGGHTNGATWNPLNSTLGHARFGYMGAHISTYPDYETGMRETISNINEHYYDKVRADLQAGADPSVTTADIKASQWGTWHGRLDPAADVRHAADQVAARHAAHPTSAAPTSAAPTSAASTNATPTNAMPTNATPTGATPTSTAPATGASSATSLLGADVDGLDHLSREFTTAAGIVDAVKAACEAIVAAASIFGPFGAAFVAYLKTTVVPWLAKIGEALRAMATVLAGHSQAQKDASAATPGTYSTPANLPGTSTANYPTLGAAPATPPPAAAVTSTAAAPLIGAL